MAGVQLVLEHAAHFEVFLYLDQLLLDQLILLLFVALDEQELVVFGFYFGFDLLTTEIRWPADSSCG